VQLSPLIQALLVLDSFSMSPYKKILYSVLVPTQFKFVLIMLKRLSFLTFFCRRVKNITKSSSIKHYRKI